MGELFMLKALIILLFIAILHLIWLIILGIRLFLFKRIMKGLLFVVFAGVDVGLVYLTAFLLLILLTASPHSIHS
tara:strand:- start:926 stop:1150 length:225 start_codon:yes stop_codon:yes gene_type:complete